MKHNFHTKRHLTYLIMTAFLLIYACNEDGGVPRLPLNKTGDDPDQISWDFKVTIFDSSRIKANVSGRRARIYERKRETLLDTNVRVEFISLESGARVSLLTSDNAKIDDNTRNMSASGNVVVLSDSNQTTLETNYLEWDNATQKLRSNQYVKITSPYEIIQGYGFESDQSLSNYKIYKVSGEQK